MSVTALIQFFVNNEPRNPGEAIIAGVGDQIIAANSDDTNVASWKYELLSAPPGSAFAAPTVQGPGALPNYTFASFLDVPGSYRVRLSVVGLDSSTDRDIRNVIVPFPNLGILAPPYQAEPPPLPLVGTGAKPDELNVGGQPNGWMGDFTVVMMHQLLQMLDNGISSGATGPAGGNLSGTYPNPVVAKINSATVPAAGALTVGHALKVTGPSSLGYAPVNVGGGANHVTGLLPIANLAAPNFGAQNVVTTGTGSFIGLTLTGLSFGLAHVAAGGLFSSSLLTDIDVHPSAGIQGTKITTNFGAQNIITTGSAAFNGGSTSAPFSMGGNKLTSVANGTSPSDGANVSQLGPTVSSSITTSAAVITPISTIALLDDYIYSISFEITARDTGTNLAKWKDSQDWYRASGSGATILGTSDGPAAPAHSIGALDSSAWVIVAPSGNSVVISVKTVGGGRVRFDWDIFIVQKAKPAAV